MNHGNKHFLVNVLRAAPSSGVAEVINNLFEKNGDFDLVTYIYVVDHEKLVGVLSIKELLRAKKEVVVSEIMQANPVVLHSNGTTEQAAALAIRHGIKAVPITDSLGKFLGVIGTDTILHTLHKDHIEDLLRLGGIKILEQKHIMEMLFDRVGHLLRIRLPWLILGLGGGFLATLIVSQFQEELSKILALAFFIPVIVYMSDAIGTQTQTLFIRALAIKKFSLKRYILKEVSVDVVLGAILGAIIMIFSLIWGQKEVALVVGLAMAINVVLAGTVAILISWILYRAHKDPAIGAGPFATVVQDVLSLVVYFVTAKLIL